MDNLEEKETICPGLTPVRTARVMASLIALVGMVFLFLERVLSAVLVMASDAVKLGLDRYNNFTGRFAAQNFAEDKQLLTLLKESQKILPSAESALTVFLVIAIVLLVVAVVGLALPRQFVHVLVALKLFKWETGVGPVERTSLREALTRIGEMPLKKMAIPFVVLLVLVVGFFIIRSCSDKVEQVSHENAMDDMQQRAFAYIEAQRTYFAKAKTLGGAKALQLADTLSTDYFSYRVGGASFTAVLKDSLENCPAGSRWAVKASTKGFFEKELVLYRQQPKDSACVRLAPDFRNLGRKNSQKTK